ncbi:GNAT family N-acetyltransferase [uncultured Oscillibacter sp.]|uniref:GNAT family N-acetyltransferase n=1 Tax=uncultured Oscillibacter sp. TaxID=876091 RepID=UPI0025F8D14C|nr:GNAT family N-acetyltransferase [uncultured Oscillibacter sp.]
MEFVELTPENLAGEHLGCIIRSKKPHPGVEAKRQWLAERLREGHVFRKLPVKAPVFVEYAPLETAWVPVTGDKYLYLYCLWVDSAYKGHGYGRALLMFCLEDARRQGRSGVCMLGAKKQKAWLSDQAFAKKFGFEAVDATADGYELLARSFDGTVPRFTPEAKAQRVERRELTVYYDMQCPFVLQRVETLREYCQAKGVPASFLQVDTLQKAKALPCVFNNWAVCYQGVFQTVNQLDAAGLERILRT